MHMKGDNPLSPKQQLFCQYYVESSNASEAAIKAGYSEKCSCSTASRLLSYEKIQNEIENLQKATRKANIASAQEVMEYFTRVMNGEVKDQFGLEAPLSERTKAAQELAKRTVDIENRLAGKEDTTVTIKLDWSR